MTFLEVVAVLLAGAAAGTINTVVGSGTLITFPTLLALGLPPVTANVSNTIGLVPGSVSGAIGYRRELRGQLARVVRLGSASVAGGVVGLLFPPSLIASAVVGAGAGGIWGKVRDKGFKDDDLREVGDSLPAGSSAIIAVAEDRVVAQLESGLHGYERIAKQAVSAEAGALILAEAPADTADTTA